MSVQDRLRGFLQERYGVGLDGITGDTSLLDSGLIDSAGILELVGFVEREFRIQVADQQIVPEHFETVRLLAAFIDSKRTGSPA